VPLRIDPNGAWSMQTALDAAEKLGPLIEYYEDPVAGLDGMAQLHRETGLPLATNMVVISFDGFRESIKRNSVQIVLSDHHYWGACAPARIWPPCAAPSTLGFRCIPTRIWGSA
jgi:glucarate dehydratase